jgi:hypothetical protein
LPHVAQHKKLPQQPIFSEIKRLRGVAEFEIANVSGKVWFWFWFVSNQKSRIRNQKFPMGPLACCSAIAQWLPPDSAISVGSVVRNSFWVGLPTGSPAHAALRVLGQR